MSASPDYTHWTHTPIIGPKGLPILGSSLDVARTINKAGDENYFHKQLLKYGPIVKITTLGESREIIKLFFLFVCFFSSLPSPSLVCVQKAWVGEGGDKWKISGGGWLFRTIGPTFQHSKTFDSLVEPGLFFSMVIGS